MPAIVLSSGNRAFGGCVEVALDPQHHVRDPVAGAEEPSRWAKKGTASFLPFETKEILG